VLGGCLITEKQVEAALDYIRDNASEYAKAKSERVYLEQFRKSKKAILMNQVEGAEHVRASYAYAHPEYLEIIEGLRQAVEIEEKLKWIIEAARIKVDVWRTQAANNRMIDGAHR